MLAAAPALVGLIGSHRISLFGGVQLRADGVTIVLLAGGLLAVAVGLFAYRQMDQRTGIAIIPELWNALLGRGTSPQRPRHAGLFVALEGGEGSGKSTQTEHLRSWLASAGREVVITHEPGGTTIGATLRKLLLDPTTRLHPRTEALLYAADRAEHVARVIEPALARGAVVVSDRFIDSSVAYQGAGRQLGADGVAALSRWATQSLVPDITILLDLPAEIGLRRVRERAERNSSTRGPSGPATSPTAGIDRIEAEQLAFHERVREGFHRLADSAPGRYVVLDADQPPRTLHNKIRDVISERLRADRDSVAADPPVRPASTEPAARPAPVTAEPVATAEPVVTAETRQAETVRAESIATEATTAVTAELLPGRPTATGKAPSAR